MCVPPTSRALPTTPETSHGSARRSRGRAIPASVAGMDCCVGATNPSGQSQAADTLRRYFERTYALDHISGPVILDGCMRVRWRHVSSHVLGTPGHSLRC